MHRIILLSLLVIFSFTSCKKELDVKVEQTFIETGKESSSGSLGFGGVIVTLMPDGKAALLNGGDVFEGGTYVIKSGDVVVKMSNSTFRFKIISKTELRYEKNRILQLNPDY